MNKSAATSVILATERLHLRAFTLDDADFILRLLNEATFIANIGDRGVRTLDDARAYLAAGPLASYAANGFGLWLIEQRTDRQAVGMCGLLKRDVLPDADIGYALLPEFAGRGYALEAAAATLELAQQTLGLARILAIVNPSNAGSIRLLERLGFAFERMVQMSAGSSEICLYARGA